MNVFTVNFNASLLNESSFNFKHISNYLAFIHFVLPCLMKGNLFKHAIYFFKRLVIKLSYQFSTSNRFTVFVLRDCGDLITTPSGGLDSHDHIYNHPQLLRKLFYSNTVYLLYFNIVLLYAF